MAGSNYYKGLGQRVYKGAKRKFKKRYGTWSNPNIKQIAKDVAFVKTLVNAEKKFIDTVSSGTTLAAAPSGTLVLLNGSTQGDTYTNRDGNSFKMVSLQIQGAVSMPSAALRDFVRISVVLDQQPNAAAPTGGISSIYDVSVSSGSYALRAKQTVDRFKVLKEIVLPLSANGNEMQCFKEFLTLDVHTKNNDSNTGTISDIYTNALYLVFAGNNSSNQSTIYYSCRVRFIDN